MSTAPVSVVTGANSGIGRAIAIHLAQKGHTVVGTVRSAARADKLLAMAAVAGVTLHLQELDIADDVSVADGFASILATYGRVDHLINNAGIGGNATVEEASSRLLLDVMNVDLVGAVRCIRAVLPQMRERQSGTIVNITSVAGRIAAIAQAPYVASKWAFEGLSEQLAQEVVGFGVRVAIIEPGVTKSAIFAKNPDAPNETGVYDAQYRRMFQMYAAGMMNATDPFEVAEVVYHAITTQDPKLRYTVSWGGPEMAEGRAAMSDEDWVGLGAIADDTEYYERFHDLLGIDIAPR